MNHESTPVPGVEASTAAAAGRPADKAKPVWIRGPQLRRRWGDMPNSTFYDRRKKRLMPEPEYPFGPETPYWRMDVIEAFERGEWSAEKAAK